MESMRVFVMKKEIDIEELKNSARFSMKNMVMMQNDKSGLGNSTDYHRGHLDSLLEIIGGEWGKNELGYHIDWADGVHEYLVNKDYGKENMFSNGEWQIA